MAKARALDKTPSGGYAPSVADYSMYAAKGATRTPEMSSDTTPFALPNQAAMRGYARNAPYLEGVINDPQSLMTEMRSLQAALMENPNDPVNEYRLRILRQAMGDIYGTQAPEYIGYSNQPSYPTTPRGR